MLFGDLDGESLRRQAIAQHSIWMFRRARQQHFRRRQLTSNRGCSILSAAAASEWQATPITPAECEPDTGTSPHRETAASATSADAARQQRFQRHAPPAHTHDGWKCRSKLRARPASKVCSSEMPRHRLAHRRERDGAIASRTRRRTASALSQQDSASCSMPNRSTK